MKRILKYWPEFIVFGVLFVVYAICASPSLTWYNMAVDGTAYVMSAKYLYPAHKTSAPLYLLTGHFFMMPPIGTEYWRLAMMSAVFALGCLIFTYLIVRQLLKDNPRNRLYALIAVAVFGSSMMLISQAVVVVPFTMVTMFSLAAFYFTLKKKWAWVAVMLGLGLATHHLILITWIVLILFFKEMRNWKRILITLAFVLFYLYIPLSKAFSDQPDMWLNTNVRGFLQDNIFTLSGLAGGVAIWDLPKRILELFGFWGVCFTIGLIPLGWFIWKQKYWKQPLFWLFGLPWVYACFPAGTKIITMGKRNPSRIAYDDTHISRKSKSIEEIRVGDIVFSYNERKGIKEWKTVTRTYSKEYDKFVLLKFSNGNELRCTDNHPIAVNRQGAIQWIEASQLKVRDEVIQAYYHNFQNRLRAISQRGKTVEELFGDEGGARHREHTRIAHLGGIGNPHKASPERKERSRLSHLGKKPTDEARRNMSLAQRKLRQNPEFIDKLTLSQEDGKHRAEAQVRIAWGVLKSSIKQARKWKHDKKFASETMARLANSHTHNKLPTRGEKIVQNILDSVCPNEFGYNGRGEYGFIGRYAPDFININGKKQIVEMFGCYFHNCPQCKNEMTIHHVTPEMRRNLDAEKLRNYEKLGYKTLVIWEHETKNKNIEATIQKVKNFLYNPDAEVITVTDIIQYQDNQTVYNLETEDNHNYFAYGILVHNCTDLDPHVSRYALAGVGFGSVIIALAITKLKMQWVWAVGISSAIMLGINGNYFDFGRTLDPQLTATKFYNEEYPKLKDGQIFLNMLPGGEWEMTFYYNKKEGRNIIPICMGMLPNPAYQEQLRGLGVNLLGSDLKNGTDAEVEIAKSIVELNPDVMVTKPTSLYDYGAVLVPAAENMNELTQWAGYKIQTVWHFKPSNPYDILTGKLELTQWKWTLQSTWDFKFFFVLFIIWLIGKWFMDGMPRRKKAEVKSEPNNT
jgi:G:T-mismatch repair DNA endonuclease (very short patch repair protein)